MGVSFQEMKHGDIYVGSKNPKLLLTAHVDEVGFVVQKLNADGTCEIKDIGWVYPWLLHGREIQVRTKTGEILYGVVLYDKAFDTEINSWKKLRADFGFNSPAELKKHGIEKGSLGTYKKNYWETEHRIFGTAIDNRLGVWTLLQLIAENKEALKKGVSFAFTSYEEMTNDGAKITIPFLKPEYLCVVDVMPHSLLDNPKKMIFDKHPYVLEKTLDYELPVEWKKLLKDIQYYPIKGKSKYLKNSEPKIFQRKGIHNSINFVFPVLNYHHGAYSCHKTAVEATKAALGKIIGKFAA
jgi:putative aminopeptidase FrvX